MTYLPDDLIDPVEAQLVRRVRGYTEAVIVPIDAMAIAAGAAARARGAGQRRSGLLGGFASRLVLAGATIGIVLVALGVVLGPGTEPTPTGPTATLNAFGLPGDACPRNKLGITIGTWDGAAGNRIAHVSLKNWGQDACLIPSIVALDLLDNDRNVLITGQTMTSWTWVRIGPEQVVTTLVDASNYCGPAPVKPVTIDFIFPLDSHVEATAAADPESDSGVPPCNGASQPGHIEMQPWSTGGTGGALPPASLPPAGPRTCTFRDVDAAITEWSGAAGSRIATVELHQLGPNGCFINSIPKVDLVGFVDGSITALIVGAPDSGSPLEFQPGDVVYSLVDVSNYCGPDPDAPITVAFGRDMGDVNGFTATPLSPTDLSGVPPCNGPGQPGHIEMHPWSFNRT